MFFLKRWFLSVARRVSKKVAPTLTKHFDPPLRKIGPQTFAVPANHLGVICVHDSDEAHPFTESEMERMLAPDGPIAAMRPKLDEFFRRNGRPGVTEF